MVQDPTRVRFSAAERPWWRSIVARIVGAVHGEAGMSTVEYAIGTVAAAAFAALLYTVVTGDSITSALDALVQRALSVDF